MDNHMRNGKDHEDDEDDVYNDPGFEPDEFDVDSGDDSYDYTHPDEARGPAGKFPRSNPQNAVPRRAAPPPEPISSEDDQDYLEPDENMQPPPPRPVGRRAPPELPVYNDGPMPPPPRASNGPPAGRGPPPVPKPLAENHRHTGTRPVPPPPVTSVPSPPGRAPPKSTPPPPAPEPADDVYEAEDFDEPGEVYEDPNAVDTQPNPRKTFSKPPAVPNNNNNGAKSFLFSQHRMELEKKLQSKGQQARTSKAPPSIPPPRPDPEPRSEQEQEQDTYEDFENIPQAAEPSSTPPPPVSAPPKAPPKMPTRHVNTTPVHIDEEYTELPEPINDDEYTVPEEEPRHTSTKPRVPSTKAAPPPPRVLPPTPASPTSPVHHPGLRIGDTLMMKEIQQRGTILKSTQFEKTSKPTPPMKSGPAPPPKPEPMRAQPIDSNLGVRGIAAKLDAMLGGGGGSPFASPPGRPSPHVSHPTDNGYDPVATVMPDRISSASNSSVSTDGSRDSVGTNTSSGSTVTSKHPPSLPPRHPEHEQENSHKPVRTDMPLPPIPRSNGIESRPWYHPQATRQHGQTLVENGKKTGSFLIRASHKSPDQPYTLVVNYHGKVKNIPIRKRYDNKYAFGKQKADETAFLNVIEMVEFHESQAILLDGGGEVRLLHPVKH